MSHILQVVAKYAAMLIMSSCGGTIQEQVYSTFRSGQAWAWSCDSSAWSHFQQGNELRQRQLPCQLVIVSRWQLHGASQQACPEQPEQPDTTRHTWDVWTTSRRSFNAMWKAIAYCISNELLALLGMQWGVEHNSVYQHAMHSMLCKYIGGNKCLAQSSISFAMTTPHGPVTVNAQVFWHDTGRVEFTTVLPENTQAVVIQPIGNEGVLIAASNIQRGFTRLDQVTWSGKLCYFRFYQVMKPVAEMYNSAHDTCRNSPQM